MTVSDARAADVERLAARFGVEVVNVPEGADIRGSFWGEPEAGIVGRKLFLRADTPLHSYLHELAHIVCMPDDRRRSLNTDAGGDDVEEAAVCYLQILLADEIADVGSARIMSDMDAWGYSFRLGSTSAWFAQDADDAHAYLCRHGLIDASGQPSWRLRCR
ncbi:MAG: hypothetical protein R3315_11230 [Woeseiaceae bacterium]|nr:hypothetical protein [Woeseiaceae bacterium]